MKQGDEKMKAMTKAEFISVRSELNPLRKVKDRYLAMQARRRAADYDKARNRAAAAPEFLDIERRIWCANREESAIRELSPSRSLGIRRAIRDLAVGAVKGDATSRRGEYRLVTHSGDAIVYSASLRELFIVAIVKAA